jgi:hypothetical protein
VGQSIAQFAVTVRDYDEALASSRAASVWAEEADTKGEIVAALQKSIADAGTSLKAVPEEHFVKTLSPWIDVIEHAAEHYGQLVVYYRTSGLVPPDSRPKAKTN